MEAIFKYIFTMLVGAMFIIFFVSFAYKQIGSAETVDALVLVRGFDDYLLLLTANEEAKDVRDFSAVTTIGFNEGKITSKTEKTGTNRIIYAPKTLTGKKITTRTMRWAFPYPVDNFFYITNEKYKQVIVYDDTSSDFTQELMQDISTTFDIRNVTKSKLQQNPSMGGLYTGMTRVTFLLISDNSWDTATKNKVKAAIPKAVFLSAKGEGLDEDTKWRHGTIKFEDGEADYLENEMLIGALYTEDLVNYEYNFKKAMDRLSAISGIYVEKAKTLSVLEQSRGCSYGMMIQGIGLLANAKTESRDISQLVSHAEDIERTNKREFGGECPAVF